MKGSPLPRPGGPTNRHRILWLVPALTAAHNAEEALTFPRYLPLALERFPPVWRSFAGAITLGQVWAALAVVGLIPLGLAGWAAVRPGRATPVWLLLLFQTTLLVNAGWHISAAIVLFDGYAPGLVTAVLLNLPFSIYLLRRAARESWVGPRARLALLPGALVLHGPLLSALLLLMERW